MSENKVSKKEKIAAAAQKTVMCENIIIRGFCPYKSCIFAHDESQLRPRPETIRRFFKMYYCRQRSTMNPNILATSFIECPRGISCANHHQNDREQLLTINGKLYFFIRAAHKTKPICFFNSPIVSLSSTGPFLHTNEFREHLLKFIDYLSCVSFIYARTAKMRLDLLLGVSKTQFSPVLLTAAVIYNVFQWHTVALREYLPLIKQALQWKESTEAIAMIQECQLGFSLNIESQQQHPVEVRILKLVVTIARLTDYHNPQVHLDKLRLCCFIKDTCPQLEEMIHSLVKKSNEVQAEQAIKQLKKIS